MPVLTTYTTTPWIELLILIVAIAPLVAALTAMLISSRYSWVAAITSPLLLLSSSIAALLLFLTVWNSGTYVSSTTWFTIATQKISAGIHIDNLSAVMVLLVSVISFLVHLYSSGYMAGDTSLRRYFAVLGFFTFTMLGLVLADNLLLIFVFWELVGFSSYLLIGHWTERPDAAAASTKAFIVNRIGDLGFLIALLIIWSTSGTFSISQVTTTESFSWQTMAALCLLIGAIGKSAQFPLLTWLPDAMAGPTPVSALIHAATLVAAGVFLLARMYFLFTPEALNVAVAVGLATALIGALSALYQHDIKKILAYSTISQLGLMVLAIGVGAPEVAILHLFTHAFFKAGLFLAAGSVIHTVYLAMHTNTDDFDVQDIRNLGGLRKYLPVTFIVFLLCGASLAGIPFFSGFLSKEAIISQTIRWATEESWRWGIVAGVFLTSFLSALYIFRLIWFVFIKENVRISWEKFSPMEAPAVMRVPMIILATCSCWFLISVNPFVTSGWLYQHEHSSVVLTITSVLWIFMALIIAYILYKNKSAGYAKTKVLTFFYHGFYLDKIYEGVLVKPVIKISSYAEWTDVRVIDRFLHFVAYSQATVAHLAGWFDKIFVDGFVNGIAWLARVVGQLTRSFQGGKIQHYIFWSVLWLIILVFLMKK